MMQFILEEQARKPRAGVIGLPHDVRGELVVAVVSLREGATGKVHRKALEDMLAEAKPPSAGS